MATIEIGPCAGRKLFCVLCTQSRCGRCVQRWDTKQDRSWVPGPNCPGTGTYELLAAAKLEPEAVSEWLSEMRDFSAGPEAHFNKIMAFLAHARWNNGEPE